MITDFPTTIEDIVSTFQSQQMPNVSQDTQLWILMEVLGGIPPEVSIRDSARGRKHSKAPIENVSRIFQQSQVMFASVQRAAVRNEVCKRTPYVINIVQQFILSKLDQTMSDSDMSTLIRAVKCAEAWLK